MPEMEVEFEVICECGHGLCANTRVSHNRRIPQVIVEPCDRCLASKYDAGKEDGYEKGYDDAGAKYSNELRA